MRYRLLRFGVLAGFSLAGWSQVAYAVVLVNGNFEATPWTNPWAPSWDTANQGSGWTWSRDAANFRGTQAQKVSRITSNTSNWGGVRQTVSANVGDAFSLADAWVYCATDSTKTAAQVRVAWDGTQTYIGNNTILATAAQSAGGWYQFTSHPGGNATSTSVTFGFITRTAPGNGASTDLTATWDDLVINRAYVPPAPGVSDPTDSTLTVDVNPGGNSENPLAEFAIGIGSGWVQTDGTTGATPAWLTDAEWGSKTVSGLAANTTYDFEVLARYGSDFPQATLPQGFKTSMTTTPEPATMGLLLAVGSLALLRRRG